MQSPLICVAVHNRLTPCLSQSKYTYRALLFIKVCSDPTPGLCSTALGKMHSLMFSVALQDRLTACLWHHRHTYADLLFIKVCSDPTPGLCSTALGKM